MSGLVIFVISSVVFVKLKLKYVFYKFLVVC